jgi:hypothetical protein
MREPEDRSRIDQQIARFALPNFSGGLTPLYGWSDLIAEPKTLRIVNIQTHREPDGRVGLKLRCCRILVDRHPWNNKTDISFDIRKTRIGGRRIRDRLRDRADTGKPANDKENQYLSHKHFWIYLAIGPPM